MGELLLSFLKGALIHQVFSVLNEVVDEGLHPLLELRRLVLKLRGVRARSVRGGLLVGLHRHGYWATLA